MKIKSRKIEQFGYAAANSRFHTSVENDKRKQALSVFRVLDLESRIFFERIISVKKARDFVFIDKQSSKHR